MTLDTTNLLRPTQVEEANEELRRMEDMLNAPPHIRNQISDRREMSKHRERLKTNIEKYTPRAFSEKEKDPAINEFEMLAGQISEGMLSSEEMRRNPPGATSRHIAWEKRNKLKIMRYKHLALRLHASGDLPASLRLEGDVASIERLRPISRGAQQLSMDRAQIPKKRDIHFGADPVGAVAFSDAEIETLQAKSPSLAEQLALLPNELRAEIKKVLGKTKAEKPENSEKREAFRAAQSEKMKARWAAKRAAAQNELPLGAEG